MGRIILLFIFSLFLVGCAKLAHLQQLLTLKAYSQNQDLQAKHVKAQDQKFEELLEVVKTDSFDQYPDKKSFLKAFGDPVFLKKVVREGIPYDLWLYRYAVQLKGSEKVYLYFDKSGKLHDWKHVAAKQQTE